MECIIPSEPILGSVALANSIPLSITPRHLAGLLILMFCSFIRRRSLSGYSDWEKAHKPIGPSLGPSPAPIITTNAGYWGLSFWFYSWLIFLVLLPIVFDLIILDGRVICGNAISILAFVEGGIDDLVSFAMKLLRALAAS